MSGGWRQLTNVDEDELVDNNIQMSIQDSCQTERRTGSGGYRHRTVTICNLFDALPSNEVNLHLLLFLQE